MSDKQFEKTVIDGIKNMDKRYIKAFLWAFALVNLAFLFHGINFMFGDHDWNYVRGASYWNEGAFEGRPLHFILQAVLFDGQVVPFLNNLLSFAALVAGNMLLAKYWQVPLTTINYVLFATFTSVLPYTLVWLYYAKDTLINLSLPLICILSLMAASSAVAQKKPWLHVVAFALMLFAFASYAAVINYFGVCLIGGVITSYVAGRSLKDTVKEALWIILDITVALIAYKGILTFSSLTSDYNTTIINSGYLPQKLAETARVMFSQFVVPLPFMEYKYKLLLLVVCLWGAIAAMIRAGYKKIPILLLLFIGLLFASKLAFFIADERGQVLAEMENFAFVPRLDFYGLVYVYALAVALILSVSGLTWQRASIVVLCIITFMSVVRDMYAQKVWKLGFDAEMKTHERIVSRLEQHPEFDPRRRYRLLQIGSFSLRQNYYRRDASEAVSLDLLETSFTPQFMSRIVYNFYYPKDVFFANASVADLSRRGHEFLASEARPWPSRHAIFFDNNIIIIVLTEEGLQKARRG